jgi:hypothetical protein
MNPQLPLLLRLLLLLLLLLFSVNPFTAAAAAAPTWMVKTMPTKPAVSSATPSDLGPTSCSWSRVLRQWILPAAATAAAAAAAAAA